MRRIIDVTFGKQVFDKDNYPLLEVLLSENGELLMTQYLVNFRGYNFSLIPSMESGYDQSNLPVIGIENLDTMTGTARSNYGHVNQTHEIMKYMCLMALQQGLRQTYSRKLKINDEEDYIVFNLSNLDFYRCLRYNELDKFIIEVKKYLGMQYPEDYKEKIAEDEKRDNILESKKDEEVE